MAHIVVSKHNPLGLTLKQQLFIAHLVTDIRLGKPIRPKDCVKRVYDVKNDATARVMASENLSKPNIRKALQYKLTEIGLFGGEDKIVQKLGEGLDAVDNKGNRDHGVRLRYIQEIFKITGLYDNPINNKVESKPYIKWSDAVLNSKIAELQEELQM